jgi:PAS domain S-box-containing protein
MRRLGSIRLINRWVISMAITKKSMRSGSLATIVFAAMLGVTPFESTKQLLFPHLTLWQSHVMTIVAITLACVVSALLVMRHETKLVDAARQAENMYRNLVENAVEGIFQTTPDGAYLSVNPALAHMYGYESPEELMSAVKDIGHQVYVDPNRRAEFKRLIANDGTVQAFEYEVYRKDGKKIWLSENARAVRNGNGAILHYEGTVEDVTERKSLEQHLRQALKMEAVGRLAGGVAHDFNNLLTVIQGHSEILQQSCDPGSPALRSVNAIKKAAQTASSLTRQLLAFSRMQVIQPRVLDLNAVLIDMAKMLPRLIPEDIELNFKPSVSLRRVMADPNQMEQVIINLVLNARDAMPQGGKLTIETRNIELDEKYVTQHPSAVTGRFAMLAVSDTGQGMDARTQARIFEPFFTTKELGKGTGLGLATVYGVIKQSGGWIWVYSELGKGTTFKIYMPQVEKPEESQCGSTVDLPLPRGKETILLVEDQDSIRELASEALRANGYKMLEASNGSEAYEIATGKQAAIDLLVTDVVMPHMGGRELADRLAPRFPGIKVLYISGYAEYAAKGHGILDENTILLQKPFSMSALVRKVREVLDTVAAASDLRPVDRLDERQAGT